MKDKEKKRLEKLKEFENRLYSENIKYIAGIDEAGRGPLAGPVVVGCVIMKPDSFIEGINDSKKILESKREKLYETITEEAIDWSVGIVSEKEIDEINILNATKKALNIAIKNLNIKPEKILVDALENIDTCNIPYISVIKGDAKIYSISAASIVAKVTRDAGTTVDNYFEEIGTSGIYTLADETDRLGVGNGKNMIDVLNTRNSTNSDKLGNLAPEEFLMKGVSKIGIQADSIENQGTSQESISKSIEDRLMSETSVDLNEELTDMIKYQRSYQASARVFNTCCDILNTLVQLGA